MNRLWSVFLALGLLLLAACEADDSGALDLRLNQIQVKGTHNSYHQVKVPLEQWNYAHAPLDQQLEEQGVRQLELDVHWDGDRGLFTVFHMPIADNASSCDTFVECLTVVKGWSDAHPDHQPLFILVEPKDDVDRWKIEGHYGDLDAEIFSVWPRQRLIMPDDVRGGRETIEEGVLLDGWPLLEDCRGKALFVMLDQSQHATNYLADDPNLTGRPLFVSAEEGEPWAAYIEVGNPLSGQAEIQRLVQKGYLLRTAADGTEPDQRPDNPQRAAAAIASGAQLISTDFPSPGPLPDDYWFQLPGGSPWLCKPLVAPADCQPSDVEALFP
jgi:hypothetical protein